MESASLLFYGDIRVRDTCAYIVNTPHLNVGFEIWDRAEKKQREYERIEHDAATSGKERGHHQSR